MGAIGIFSFVSGLIELADGVQDWIDAWRAITRPIWNFLLGWFFEWSNWQFPWWLKDYLTCGLVNSGMVIRTYFYDPPFKVRSDRSRILHVKKWYLLCIGWWIFLPKYRKLYKGKLKTTLFILYSSPAFILFWPINIASHALQLLIPNDSLNGVVSSRVYFETFIWALIIIAINYALFLSNTASPKMPWAPIISV